jgi:serine/threonine protein kinase
LPWLELLCVGGADLEIGASGGAEDGDAGEFSGGRYGGQGIVYLTEDVRLRRSVALKVLNTPGPRFEVTIRRFQREAEVASRLEHPGICGVYDAGIAGGIPHIAMKYVQGVTPAWRIAHGPQSPTPVNRGPARGGGAPTGWGAGSGAKGGA